MKLNKLNLHAHSLYSDGHDTIAEMVSKYQEYGFMNAVITDHVYNTDKVSWSSNYKSYKSSLIEAKQLEDNLNFPVIIGVEIYHFFSEELLLFGTEAIEYFWKIRNKNIYKNILTFDFIKHLKENYNCAIILPHPFLQNGFVENNGHKLIDGYEKFNKGKLYFHPLSRNIPLEFRNLKQFSNSDAHSSDQLQRGYNLVNEMITTENELIDFLKKDNVTIELYPNV